jgi:hypothetical protein
VGRIVVGVVVAVGVAVAVVAVAAVGVGVVVSKELAKLRAFPASERPPQASARATALWRMLFMASR